MGYILLYLTYLFMCSVHIYGNSQIRAYTKYVEATQSHTPIRNPFLFGSLLLTILSVDDIE